MSEEYEESDIIFSEQATIQECNQKTRFSNIRNDEKGTRQRVAAKKTSPMSIPVNNFRRTEWETTEEEEEEEEEEDKTPPHVIVERRLKEQIAFSVCALKGRDLNRHRNSVLRMTGFLEA
ncbi:unnamed protein product [Brassica oleracea var. botrytis]|uniref:Uncharacterized protein n=2 Tax=Brassica TaxID=3705 RepID=A0A0D3E6N9_BRAOL|nr:PREDICTED: uncharacterized protein LOC106317189 [Brassica oleracea var. oleracea]CAF1733676.1 unnamed protein product [Brassica napus]